MLSPVKADYYLSKKNSIAYVKKINDCVWNEIY